MRQRTLRNMRDFTLYLNWIDPNRFSKEQSRFGLGKFADEWKAAWHAYKTHVYDATSLLGGDSLRDFALADWRQDLRDARCIRKKPVTKIKFCVVERLAEFVVGNPVLHRDLRFQYHSVTSFCWNESPKNNVPLERQAGDGVQIPVLYLEELRFPKVGAIEHEFFFLDGSRLLVSAASLRLNLKDYLID